MKASRRALPAAAVALAGCDAAALADRLTPRLGYAQRVDLAYGPLPRHRLDLYLPDGMRADSPLLVFLHGGGWRSGSKDLYRFVGEAFATRGFATAIPNYRLYPEVAFPGFVEDAARAMAWLAVAPGLPAGPRVAVGHSAGAHIAMMLALDARWLQAAGAPLPAGAVGLAGPYDIMPLRRGGRLAAVFGGENRPETQPIAFADRPGPPMLLLHGMADATVAPEQSERLAARRRAAGFPVRLVTYGDVGHVDILGSLAAPLRGIAPPVLRDIADFVTELQGRPT
ncbi:alpha/beta hydrolase [Roseomonas sp. PWR1]|uniref:Alpha/beta hydrolase n=1 Tax=Roseomonas nitratireducens TaxID=2820810 RepID=A0ABS4AS25_9PROT|nr:alpha/beta hydrolase [Neoroseomonas nitratireducens]MBP0464136.1 alpha/beta hydrolase [Neoroseomonas nitratireducens]